MERHERLKQARRRRFRSAREAASYFRMPYSTFAHHEAGTRGIKDSELKAYASAYRVNLSWLAHEQGAERGPPDKQIKTGAEEELLTLFRLLPVPDQDVVLSLCEGLLRRLVEHTQGEPAPRSVKQVAPATENNSPGRQ